MAIGLLAGERVSPPLALLGAVTVLLVAGVIDAGQAFAGFSNPAPLTVAALYVVAAAAEKTRVLERATTRLLAGGSSGRTGERGALARILVPTAAASAFLNNTPIVAMVAPSVVSWARQTGHSPSRYLMPLSFAAILGGVVTVVGTSTNLVVSGLLVEAGEAPLGLFEIGQVGLPLAVAGIVLLVAITPWLLAARRAPSEVIDGDAREFTVEMLVTGPGTPAGSTVAEAGLRNLEGVYLVEVEREGRRIAPVRPDETLAVGDRLTFAGNVGRILDLQARPGLVSAEERHFGAPGREAGRQLFEAVVAAGSQLVGSTLKEVGFRSGYDGAVLAIHRAGGRVPGKLGEVELHAGDVLLVLADPSFRRRWLGQRDFLVVAPLDAEPPGRRGKAGRVGLVMVALLALAGTGTLDILSAALLAAFAVVLLGVLTPREARDAVDLNIVVLIAASFGVGAAMTASGLAEELAELVIGPLGGLGDLGLLLGVIIVTTVLTEVITNNAAAVLVFPIALAAATQVGADPRAFAIAIAVGASSSFLTPIGYQTNTMVYGMGGYRFGDFARLGVPLTLLMLLIAALVIPYAWPLR